MALATLDDVFPGAVLYEAGSDLAGKEFWLHQVMIKSDLVLGDYIGGIPHYKVLATEEVIDSGKFYSAFGAQAQYNRLTGVPDWKFLGDMGVTYRYNMHYTFTSLEEARECLERFRRGQFTEWETQHVQDGKDFLDSLDEGWEEF